MGKILSRRRYALETQESHQSINDRSHTSVLLKEDSVVVGDTECGDLSCDNEYQYSHCTANAEENFLHDSQEENPQCAALPNVSCSIKHLSLYLNIIV